MKLIDTHAHLYSEKFLEDQDDVLARAAEINEAIMLPNVDKASIDQMHALVDKAPDLCYPMMGLHPVYIPEDFEPILEDMEKRLEKTGYYGVGETGLDLYWDKDTLPRQQTSLEIHIHWAKRFGLPIILHARNAIDETYEMIAKHHDERLWGIFHCFDGNAKQEYIVIETDSPYLAPAPYRRTRNESSYTQYVARKLVEIYDLPYNEIAQLTTRNAKEIFKSLI